MQQGPRTVQVDWRVLPLLCLLAAIVCMDRTTLPMSSFQMRLKLSFGPDVYGWAVGVLYIGYALAYMPALLLVGKVSSTSTLLCYSGPNQLKCDLLAILNGNTLRLIVH